MFRLHVSFRETIHPVKVHWFALSNLTLTLMAVKLRSLRSRDRHKGQRQCGSPMECSPGELGWVYQGINLGWKNAGHKNRKKKKKKTSGERCKNSVHCIHIPSKPPPPPKVFFAEINFRWGSPGRQKFGASEDSEKDGSFFGNQWLEIPQPTWDFGGVLRCFCCRFCRKKTRNVNFCRKKNAEKKRYIILI